MSKRKTLTTTTRGEVYQRDYHVCRKCGRDEDLQLHHIQPVDAGGNNETKNLITLCGSCHREWEMLDKPRGLTFEKWLDLPSAGSLLAAIANESMWTDELTAKEARELLIQSHIAMRDLPRGD